VSQTENKNLTQINKKKKNKKQTPSTLKLHIDSI